MKGGIIHAMKSLIKSNRYSADPVTRQALILMRPDLDANYEAVRADTWPWPQDEQRAK